MVITTPSGYEVHIKDFLAFGEKRQLEKFIASRIMVKAGSDKQVDIAPVEGSINYEMQDMAFGFLVQKIIKDSNEITTNIYDEVMTWREEDGQVVFEAIDEVTSKTPLVPKKKS
jgi:hypothetical protein